MAETLEDDLEGAESNQEWLEAEPDDLEDTDAAVEDDAEPDDSTESEEGGKVAGDDTEALDQLEAEELEMLGTKLGENFGLKGIEYVDLRFHGKISYCEID